MRAAGDAAMFIVPPRSQCYPAAMPIEWTISHGSRLVVAVAKGEMLPEHMREFLLAIDREGARPYAKMIDVKGLTTRFAPEQIGSFAAVVREREAEGAVGPIAIVVGPGPLGEQVRVFSEHGQLIRPIRVFAELHEARRWLDRQRDSSIGPRTTERPSPLEIE